MIGKRVITAHGPGTVTDSDTMRGRTEYQVEGTGYRVWFAAEDIRGVEETPREVSDLSTTLPYNPDPQGPTGPVDTSTIIPGEQRIDAEERLTPSESNEQLRHEAKFAKVAHPVDMSTLQARLDEDPYAVLAEYQQAAYEANPNPDPAILQLMELESADPQVRSAAWADVRMKAVRLRKSGQVEVRASNPSSIATVVTGDHGVYDTMVVRGNYFTGDSQVTDYSCSCPWGVWAFKRSDKFFGRLCSHAYGTLLELRSMMMKRDDRTPLEHSPNYGPLFLTPASKREAFTQTHTGFWDKDSGNIWVQPGSEYWIIKSDPSGAIDLGQSSSKLGAYEILAEAGFVRLGDFGPVPGGHRLQSVSLSVGDSRESARYPRPDGRLQTQPGTLTPDFNFITEDQTPEERIDLWTYTQPDTSRRRETGRSAFIDDPFDGSGPVDYDSIGTSEEYVRKHELRHRQPFRDDEIKKFQGRARTAGRKFTQAEQDALINEPAIGGPIDQDELDLRGTHYLS